jgi:hypothetical protein
MRLLHGPFPPRVERNLASAREKELVRRSIVVPNRISPDGRYLTADSVDFASGSSSKLLIPIDGGEPRELMRVTWGTDAESLANFYSKGIELRGGQWAPDGRSFITVKFFRNGRSNERWRVPVDGSAPKKLDGRGFSLQPGGNEIAFTVSEQGPPQSQEVWVLENSLPPATRASK